MRVVGAPVRPKKMKQREPRIGPELPGGAFKSNRALVTGVGPCTMVRFYRRTRSTAAYGKHSRSVKWLVYCEGRRRGYDEESGYLRIERDPRKQYLAREYGLPAGKKLWTVGAIEVSTKRKGIATKLYETAAKYVCSKGGALVSDYRLEDAFSNDFWKKQIKKGRARPAYPYEGATFDERTPVVLSCRKASDLSGVRKPRKKPAKKKPAKKKRR
jgi:hypothetical protein